MSTAFQPHVVELTGTIEPVGAFVRLATKPSCVFLDSARPLPRLGRYSFLSCDPFATVGGPQGVRELEQLLQSMSNVAVEGLPPFQGGAMGLWSYDLARSFESIPSPRHDEFAVPAMRVGLFDVVVAFDHQTNQSWLISQGFPETDPDRRAKRARSRADQFLEWLRNAESPKVTSTKTGDSDNSASTSIAIEDLAPHFPTRYSNVFSNFDASTYPKTVQRVVDYIHAGDAFQVNLAQRLLARQSCDSISLYLRLRERNAAPFAGYFDLGQQQIISASPERFLQLRNGHVEARPIKGTRQRVSIPEADLFTGAELRASDKDISENVMIVDLMRNDLSRVCIDDSVIVSQLCGLETYQYVQHLVSVVEGQLAANQSAIDLIRATFPGGSITGAPKVRAMEIIAELEPTARGAYCGCLGYIGFDGSLDMNILIRTITASNGWWQFPVGGGIVADSDPVAEHEETWHKAEGMLRAIL